MSDRIIPFTYRPIAKKKNAYPLFFTLLSVSLALVILSMQLEHYAGVVSVFAVVGLTAAVLVYLRYIGGDYVYNVTVGSEGEAYFVIDKVVGKKITTMCVVKLESIIRIQMFTKNSENKYVPDKTVKRHNYAPSFSPDEFAVMYTAGIDGRAEVVLECSKEFADRLMLYSEYAKEDSEREENDEEE